MSVGNILRNKKSISHKKSKIKHYKIKYSSQRHLQALQAFVFELVKIGNIAPFSEP